MNLTLQQILDEPDSKILFAGVGNVLRRDDAVGVYIVSKLNYNNRIGGIVVEMGIENYIGKINSLEPDILVIVDACDFGRVSGFMRMAPVHEFMDTTTNTHNITLRKLSELFRMPVSILGIQPENTCFGEGMCNRVTASADRVITAINMAVIKES